MDEPTNHLDIRSKDILKKALIDYEGTVIMVSHDRDFMAGICDRLFEFRDGKVKEHLCGIEEFMQLRKVERLNELDLEKSGAKEQKEIKKAVVAPVVDKSNEAEQKAIKSQIKKVEENITTLEAKVKDCDDKLSDAAQYEKLMNDKTFFDNYNKLKSDLEKEMEKWEELSGKIS
jgi:ATP-binding cassette subfamily F protein 3